jgi:tRNA1Val (adenine37-N6)-methyltransferase
MSNTEFRFKRFSIEQEGCAMKVTTDGVLLGAWCRVGERDKLILDIGTGTGVIALQLAQRTEYSNCLIDAVEIDNESCARAQENFDRSPWTERLRLHHTSIQEFAASEPRGLYDHIVSNPPYFVSSLTSPDKARTLARHTHSLSHGELLEACQKLLAPEGRVSLILPVAEAENMLQTARNVGFCVTRQTEVWSTPRSGTKRLLLELSKRESSTEHSVLVIEAAQTGSFSAEYRALLRDFYLYF